MKPRPRLLFVPREPRPPARTVLLQTSESVPTVRKAHTKARLLNRRRQAAEQVVAAMRGGGAALHLSFQNGRAQWRLSSGGPLISPDVAAIVTANPSVVSVGDALFPNMPAQTWRWCE